MRRLKWRDGLLCGGLLMVSMVQAQEGQVLSDSDKMDHAALEVIQVKGRAEYATYQTVGAVSYIGQIQNFQSLDSTVRALPGTYTNINPTQGTINVNIRGMSGFGRVNTMIDGVPQTFYGTSAQSGHRYHDEDEVGYGPMSSYGAMIDPNFLVGAEISRGFFSGKSGMNALQGMVNFRTLEADDVLFPKRKWGVLSKLSYGTNAKGLSGMLALAHRGTWNDQGYWSGLFAYSASKERSNYRRADGTFANTNAYVKRLDQEPISWLAKLQFSPNHEHDIRLASRFYTNEVGGRQTVDKTHQFSYRFQSPHPWLDLNLSLARSQHEQHYLSDTMLWTLTDAQTKNVAQYASLSNQMKFKWTGLSLEADVGWSFMDNRYDKQAQAMDADALVYTPFSLTGKQSIHQFYWQQDIHYRKLALQAGISYQYGQISGYKPSCEEVDKDCFPRDAAQIQHKQHIFLPKLMLSWEALPWLTPFVSYAHSSRLPNVNEVFFNNQGASSMNPFLKSEQARTYQLGVNIVSERLLTQQDMLGVKLLAYRERIENMIHSVSVYLKRDGRRTTNLDEADEPFQAQLFVNRSEPTYARGIELSIHYDAGSVFGQLSYSHQKLSLPIDVTSTIGTGFGTTGVMSMPEDVATLTLGTRLFDRKLLLASIWKYTGKNLRLNPQGLSVDPDVSSTQTMPKIPILLDLYATYQVNKNVLIKVGVQNATNRNYIDALNALNSTSSDYGVDNDDNDVYRFSNVARGRTYFVGAEVRF